MKRTLSLVLALVMVLGTFTGVFAATEVEKTAAEFLADHGILKGTLEDGDLMLDQNLARRDAVVLLSRLFDVEEDAKTFTTSEESPSFEDARNDAYYVPFIAWAEVNEYFQGDDEGNFNPRNAITAQEYALVLLRALGYEDGEWNGVLETAEKNGLLKDVEVENKDEVVRGQMAVMTFNALGAKMFDSDETLAEFLGIEMPEEPKADKLEVKNVYAENLAEIVVELSNAELVENYEALTNPKNYRLSDNDIKVHNVDVVEDDLVLTLIPYGIVDHEVDVKTLVNGKEYSLIIRNIEGISQTKKFVARDIAVPVVENVEFIGTYGIKVTTSEPVELPEESNFRIDDKRTSMIIEQYGRELILTPYHNRSFDKDAETLTIEALEDFRGYRAGSTIEDLVLSSDEGTPEVVAAYRNGKVLTLEFDRDIFHKSVSEYKNRLNEGNVSFVERRVTFFADSEVAAKKVDTNVAVYTFEREIPRDAIITVEGVKNHFDVAMEAQDVETTLYVDDYAPIVISKLSLNVESTGELQGEAAKGKITNSTKGLKVEFDKDIRELVNALDGEEVLKKADGDIIGINPKDFFTVYRLEVSRKGGNDATDVKIIVEEIKSDSITISFSDIYVNDKYRDYDYVLEVEDFTDLNRNRMVREYIDFQIVPTGKVFDVEDGEIVVYEEDAKGTVVIEMWFTKPVDKEAAENAKNYFFGLDGKDLLVDDVVVDRNGERVRLFIEDTTKAKVVAKEILEISPAVVDLDDNSIDGSRFFNLADGTRIVRDLTDKEVAKNVSDAIKAIAEELTVEDIAAVTEALDNYDNLSAEQQAIVDENEEVTTKIAALRTELAKLEAEKAANDAAELIGALPQPYQLKLEDKEVVEEAKDAYDALTKPELVNEDLTSKLDAVVAKLAELVADAQALADAQQALADAQQALADAIQAAKDAIDEDHEVVEDEKQAVVDAQAALDQAMIDEGVTDEDDSAVATEKQAVVDAQAALDQAIQDAKDAIDEDHADVATEKQAVVDAQAALDELN